MSNVGPPAGSTVGSAWLEEVRAAIATAHGPEVADAVISRVSPHVPAGYDELSWPNSATVDLPLVDRLAAEGPDAAPATAMMQFAEAAPHQWRFRMYHGDRAVPLADLLPLLDHLGFRVIDERAFRFDMPSTAVWVHDVGVEVAVDLVSLSPAEAAARRAEVQRAFLAEFAGEIELDGFNRLVLAAGLTVRQVSVLRAYGRYMRQIGFPFSQQYIEHTLVRHPTIAAGLVACFEARGWFHHHTPQVAHQGVVYLALRWGHPKVMCHSGMNNRMQADKAAIVEGVIKRVLLQHLVPSWRAQGI
ncbi:MAG: hypothetical protein RJB61_2197, partial [Actinomycetota bacterium]